MKILIMLSLIIIAYTNTFKDIKTNLIWQTNPSPLKYTWQEAKNYCNNIKYNSKDDWRLPSLPELMSLTSKAKYNPAIITDTIDIKTDDYYWTSSLNPSDPKLAWSVYFRYGDNSWDNKGYKDYVLCVRGK